MRIGVEVSQQTHHAEGRQDDMYLRTDIILPFNGVVQTHNRKMPKSLKITDLALAQ